VCKIFLVSKFVQIQETALILAMLLPRHNFVFLMSGSWGGLEAPSVHNRVSR